MLSQKQIVPVLSIALGFAAVSLSPSAQDKEQQGPLAALPSKPGAHIEKIKALGDNQWLNLGPPAADPKWGKARGRSWGAKAFILAPDKRGAFLFGEGVHAYVKPDGHLQDDLWFYDINAHAWLCLYPGTNTKTFNQRVRDKELLIDDHGQLRDKDGQAIPVHTLVHAWGYLTYDSDRKKFAFLGWNNGAAIPQYFLGGAKQMEEGLKLLEEQRKGKKEPVFSPWYYDVASGKFERFPAKGEKPNIGGFPQFHYIPSRKQFFLVGPGADGVSIFDPAKQQWTRAKPKGAAPAGYDGCGCYDSKRNRIYRNDGDGSDGRGLMAYDIEQNTWIELKPKGDGPGAANTNAAFYEYDARLDRVVAIRFTGKAAGIHVYDPETNSWADPLPFPKDGPKFPFAANTCYDPELNAYFCHVAGDSADNGTIWVFRYKR